MHAACVVPFDPIASQGRSSLRSRTDDHGATLDLELEVLQQLVLSSQIQFKGAAGNQGLTGTQLKTGRALLPQQQARLATDGPATL